MHGYVNMIRSIRAFLISNTRDLPVIPIECDRTKAGMWTLFDSHGLFLARHGYFSLYISCGKKHIGNPGVVRCFSAIYYLQAIFARECEAN